MHRKIPLLLIPLMIHACGGNNPLVEDPESYIRSVEQWQEDRLEGLKAKDGWLNLAGIYWLEEGEQTLGSDPSNDMVFPDKAPAFMGTLTLEGEKVRLEVNEGVEIMYEGEPVRELELEADRSRSPSYLTHGDLAWYIMKRHTSLAVRLRDYAHPALEGTDHIPSWPVDPDYVVKARLEPYAEARTITVNTPFQDYTQDYQCPGELVFRLKGKKLSLLPFSSGEGYFVIISDETSGLESYGGGRFMYVYPDSAGRIILDFNKAYNPPCAVTPFAACPMPPPENHLPVRIEAGEKNLTGH